MLVRPSPCWPSVDEHVKSGALSLGMKRQPIGVGGYRERARQVLPSMAWAYLDGGADDHVTMDANVAAFRRWRLRQQVLRGVTKPDISTVMAGTRVALPVALAPVGLTGFFRWNADVLAARAAERAGTRLILSTGSSWTLEEVAEATEMNHWFQLYPYGDRTKVGALIDRASAAGYTALFVTVDVQARGNREGERRTGMGVPLRVTPRALGDFAMHPVWTWNLLRHGRAAAIHYRDSGGNGVAAAASSITAQDRYMQADLNWEDLAWMRDHWHGKLYVKGVLQGDDAVRCVHELGADGVVVSNHGGRQLDRGAATLEALPGVVEALAGRGEVYLDGGVRRGTDVITALALGADGVLIGRAYTYGVAVAGEAGVSDILATFTDDIRRGLILMGCPSVAALDRSWVMPATITGG